MCHGPTKVRNQLAIGRGADVQVKMHCLSKQISHPAMWK